VKEIVKKAKAAKLQHVKTKGQQKNNCEPGEKNTARSRRKYGRNKEDVDVPCQMVNLKR